MKRLICSALAACLLLCACGGPGQEETTVPTEATTPAPIETTLPDETTLPPETTIPAETTAPVETTVPPETTEPAVSVPPVADGTYTIRIEDPDTLIYAKPAFKSGSVALVEEAGTYTIVEETADADGNTWGRLKSGAGWICLTDPALAPIYADYAAEDFNTYHAYWTDESDYITSIGFTPAERLTNVKFGMLDWFEREQYTMSEVLYTIDEMDPDHCFLAQVVFWGDMTTYGISFTDADGAVRHYAVSISGKDGSLLCIEYKGG